LHAERDGEVVAAPIAMHADETSRKITAREVAVEFVAHVFGKRTARAFLGEFEKLGPMRG
jgi:hypothetical protein